LAAAHGSQDYRCVQLFPLDPVPVRFQGRRTGAGPLTIGQLNVVKWLTNAPQSPAALLDQTFAVPPGTTVEDVAECFAVLLSRHEGLRSRYSLGNPGEQRVLMTGEVPLSVYRDEDTPAGLVAILREKPIDVAADSPIRLAAAVRDGAVTAVVAVYSHLAVDFQALVVLGREFDEMVRDPAARVVGEPRLQPLDRAEAEREPSRRRRLDQALRHWRRQLATAPAHLYARPRVGPQTGSGAWGMSSAAAARALDHIAARTRVSRPTIVLAAVCALLSRRTGYETCQFLMLSANRFESDLRDYVGTLVQSTYVTVEVGEAPFDELVRRCFGAVLQAGRHGAYDVFRQHAESAELKAARGIAPSFEPLFNSVVVDTRGFDAPPPADAPPAPTRLAWADLPPTDILLRFDLGQIDDELVARVWTGDVGRVAPDEAKALLLAVERLLVAAAAGELDHAATVAAIGLPPIERPPGWKLIDNCWVDLAEVQRLLDDALGPAGDAPVSPAETRRRCLELLPGRHAAKVPDL
jgi:hypothetical protein